MSEDKFDLSLEDLRSMDAHQKRKVAETLVSFASFLFKWCDKNETDMAEFETAMKRLKRSPEPSPRGGEDPAAQSVTEETPDPQGTKP